MGNVLAGCIAVDIPFVEAVLHWVVGVSLFLEESSGSVGADHVEASAFGCSAELALLGVPRTLQLHVFLVVFWLRLRRCIALGAP